MPLPSSGYARRRRSRGLREGILYGLFFSMLVAGVLYALYSIKRF
jgi:hypothetical protein